MKPEMTLDTGHSNPYKRVLVRGYGVCGATLGALLSLGCTASSGSDEMDDALLGNVQEPSAIAAFTPWSMPIAVCYSRAKSTDQARDASGAFIYNDKRLTTTEYASAKVDATATLQATWPRVPGVSFTGFNDCGTTIPNNTLVMKLTPGGGGTCGGGQNAVCEMRAVLTDTNNMPIVGWERGFRPGLVHEVGHALGLAHEHKRLDAVPTSCESARVVACLSCRQDVESARPCKAADYNACFDDIPILPAPPVAFDQSFTVNSALYQAIQDVLGNNETDINLERLTVYDPQSIMNYCSGSNGRAWDDYMPTALDLLGAEMVYPLSTGHPIGCLQGCYHTSSGGVIARPLGLLQTDWADRGARNSGVLWRGTPTATLFFANFPAGTSTISYDFWAAVIPQNPPPEPRVLTASGTLVNSDSAHTAVTLAMNALML